VTAEPTVDPRTWPGEEPTAAPVTCDGVHTRTTEPCQFTCRSCLVRYHADSKPAPKLCERCANRLKLCTICEAPKNP